jgi:hypothetical protein
MNATNIIIYLNKYFLRFLFSAKKTGCYNILLTTQTEPGALYIISANQNSTYGI